MKKAKKESKKKATRKSALETEVATSTVEPAKAQIKLSYQPYTQAAWDWMTSRDSIPGAFSPILYIGWNNSLKLAEALGRPMELDEAKILVQPDGGLVKCFATEVEFQPVRYLAYVPGGLKEWLADGTPFAKIGFRYGGQFYVERKSSELLAVSGSCYHVIPNNHGNREPIMVFNFNNSPLTAAKEKFGGWAKTLEEVEKITGARKAKDKWMEKINAVAPNILIHRPGLNRMRDAFDKGDKRRGKRNKPLREEKDE